MAVVAVPFILYLVRFCSSKSCKKYDYCTVDSKWRYEYPPTVPHPPYVQLMNADEAHQSSYLLYTLRQMEIPVLPIMNRYCSDYDGAVLQQ